MFLQHFGIFYSKFSENESYPKKITQRVKIWQSLKTKYLLDLNKSDLKTLQSDLGVADLGVTIDDPSLFSPHSYLNNYDNVPNMKECRIIKQR